MNSFPQKTAATLTAALLYLMLQYFPLEPPSDTPGKPFLSFGAAKLGTFLFPPKLFGLFSKLFSAPVPAPFLTKTRTERFGRHLVIPSVNSRPKSGCEVNPLFLIFQTFFKTFFKPFFTPSPPLNDAPLKPRCDPYLS